MGILEKISEIEKEISRTQKNKGKRKSLFRSKLNFTEYLIIYYLFYKLFL